MREQKEIKELKRYVLLANNEFIDTQRRIYKPELYIEDDVPYLAYTKRRYGYIDEISIEYELSLYSTYQIIDASDDPKDLVRENDYITLINKNNKLYRIYTSYGTGFNEENGNIFDEFRVEQINSYGDSESLDEIEIQTIYKWASGCLVPVWSCEGLDAWVYQDRVKKEY